MTVEDEASFSDAEIERARVLFAGACDFMLGVVSLETLPDEGVPEVAFAGRSNVGKSSLINALTGRKGLARASNTPGRTRELNYFNLGGVMRLVDLPGYGYARASKKDVEQWSALTRDFLRGRSVLRRICVLVDARHGLKSSDEEVMDMLDLSAVNYQIVLTKADKIKPTGVKFLTGKIADQIKKRPAAHPQIMPTSAETGLGLPELRATLAALAVS
jgi:GTP-binding protein